MGFKRPVYVLHFEGTYDGLEIKAKGAPLGELVELQSLMELGEGLLAKGEEAQARRDRLVELIGSKLISWNLTEEVTPPGAAEPEEVPVPCTTASLAKEDWQMVIYIARSWIRGAVGVRDDLGKGSASGVPSEVEAIPMEAL